MELFSCFTRYEFLHNKGIIFPSPHVMFIALATGLFSNQDFLQSQSGVRIPSLIHGHMIHNVTTVLQNHARRIVIERNVMEYVLYNAFLCIYLVTPEIFEQTIFVTFRQGSKRRRNSSSSSHSHLTLGPCSRCRWCGYDSWQGC